jgi:tetratricopeptide (TPR) repeat protein
MTTASRWVARNDAVSRYVVAILCVLSLVGRLDAHAQASEECRQAVAEAEVQYVEGRFDEVISTLSKCTDRDDILVVDAVAAYRLIALAYIRIGDVEEARISITELLNRQPEYEPDPVEDIPSYVALVNLVKRALLLDAASPEVAEESLPADVPEERPRSWFRSHAGWLVGGGSAVAVGIVAILLTGGGGESGPSALPGPPALPN